MSVETFYTFCCDFEIYRTIDQADKDIIQSKLVVNEFLEEYAKKAMDDMGISAGNYTVLHIRCRDEVCFPAKVLLPEYLKMLEDKVKEVLNPTLPYLLLTNHNQLKAHLAKFSNIASRTGGICHTGGACHVGDLPPPPDDAVRDTVLDFYLMSKAKDIIGFSPYPHGTGFSQETAKLYSIRHTLIKI